MRDMFDDAMKDNRPGPDQWLPPLRNPKPEKPWYARVFWYSFVGWMLFTCGQLGIALGYWLTLKFGG